MFLCQGHRYLNGDGMELPEKNFQQEQAGRLKSKLKPGDEREIKLGREPIKPIPTAAVEEA